MFSTEYRKCRAYVRKSIIYHSTFITFRIFGELKVHLLLFFSRFTVNIFIHFKISHDCINSILKEIHAIKSLLVLFLQVRCALKTNKYVVFSCCSDDNL